MIFKCYSSKKLITLNILHEVVPTWYSFTAESTEAMRIKCLAQGNNILLPGFEPSISVSQADILTITMMPYNTIPQWHHTMLRKQWHHTMLLYHIMLTCYFAMLSYYATLPFYHSTSPQNITLLHYLDILHYNTASQCYLTILP